MIYNMNVEVMKILRSITDLKLCATDYPDDWSQFPAAIYRTAHAPVQVDAYQVERQTQWTVTVELYTDSGSLTTITEKLRLAFGEIGFFGNTTQSNTADLRRAVCTFSATVDNDLKRVYHK
ncbi:hypothetical protein [Lacticaseibacillus yichunensis]|uniref:DUF3168 domain-containing protein n=1 Tax=Lacticaseibacillus yichunensis TaxID=2486015 RepID=A0ABW4CNE6_9LACO|nr:hypothetical protein [Lacticaseibacillus yichunensis]